MSKPLLELQDVHIAFKGDVVLENVSLKIFPGDTIAIIGLSGSGKTVLLKTLAGLYTPLSGKILYNGKDWSSLSVDGKHELASHVGMQFQKSALFDDLTAFENVAYPLKEHTSMSSPEIEARALECLRAVDLEEAKHLQAHELSGGMRQRLGIARAIALKPELLFMDDPTAGLDPINSDNIVDLILKIKSEIGSTLIMVTHDLNRAYQIAGRILFVGRKSVLETGSAEQTRNHPDAGVQQYLHGRQKGPLTDGGDF